MEIILPETLRWQPGNARWLVPVSAWSKGPERYLFLRRAWLDGRPVPRWQLEFPAALPVYPLPEGLAYGRPVALFPALGGRYRRYPFSWLGLRTGRLARPQVAPGSHALDLEFATAEGTLYRARTTVLVASLPQHPCWQPAELQLHSASHDDGRWQPAELVRELSGRGYRAVYFTPHADLLAGSWQDFRASCRELSGEMAVFPGLEVAARQNAGHLLIYGLPDGAPLANASLPGQEIIDRVNRLPGHRASVTVAHPFGRPPWPWQEEPVVNYSGLEVFSGIQLHFDLQSRPVQIWLQELERLGGRAFGTGFLPSARAGSDWHQVIPYPAFVTYIYLPPGWQELGWEERKAYLDLALRRGNTIASRHGGLAYLLVNGQPPGARLTLPPGAWLEIKIHWQAVMAGPYQLFLFQGPDLERPLWQVEVSSGEGRLYEWSLARVADPAGQPAFYWLYVTGADQVLTTPVFVRLKP